MLDQTRRSCGASDPASSLRICFANAIIKKITTFCLAVIISIGAAGTVFAEPDDSASAGAEIYLEDPSLEAPDTSHAEAALLVDMNSGRTIYGKNADERLYPASTTKMMTAILALESGRMEETTTATYEALKSITLEDSHMGITIGEELSMVDLVNSMMIYSANDSANVIACHLGGTMEEFVDMMNAKALEIGMSNTHFVNPCGVHDDDHYTTANDLATLAQYCMKNEEFREIVKKPSYHIAPTNKYEVDRDLPSTNLFLSMARSSYYMYKPCTGIKTGTTEAAGHCLVSSASYNGQDLLAVVLKCDDLDVKENAFSYKVSKSLFDFGFNNYESGVVATTGTIVTHSKVAESKKGKAVNLTVESDVNALVPKGVDITKDVEAVTDVPDNLTAPISKGDVLGTVTYTYNGVEMGTANLIAANDVEQDMILHIFLIVIGVIKNPLFFIPVILIIIVALIAKSRKKRRERKKRLQQLKQRREAEESRKFGHNDRITRNAEHRRTSAKGANSRYSDDRIV